MAGRLSLEKAGLTHYSESWRTDTSRVLFAVGNVTSRLLRFFTNLSLVTKGMRRVDRFPMSFPAFRTPSWMWLKALTTLETWAIQPLFLCSEHTLNVPVRYQMFEKFSNLDIDSSGSGGEYTVQVGPMTLDFICKFWFKIISPIISIRRVSAGLTVFCFGLRAITALFLMHPTVHHFCQWPPLPLEAPYIPGLHKRLQDLLWFLSYLAPLFHKSCCKRLNGYFLCHVFNPMARNLDDLYEFSCNLLSKHPMILSWMFEEIYIFTCKYP